MKSNNTSLNKKAVYDDRYKKWKVMVSLGSTDYTLDYHAVEKDARDQLEMIIDRSEGDLGTQLRTALNHTKRKSIFEDFVRDHAAHASLDRRPMKSCRGVIFDNDFRKTYRAIYTLDGKQFYVVSSQNFIDNDATNAVESDRAKSNEKHPEIIEEFAFVESFDSDDTHNDSHVMKISKYHGSVWNDTSENLWEPEVTLDGMRFRIGPYETERKAVEKVRFLEIEHKDAILKLFKSAPAYDTEEKQKLFLDYVERFINIDSEESKTADSEYRGVNQEETGRGWVAWARIANSQHQIGVYDTQEKANAMRAMVESQAHSSLLTLLSDETDQQLKEKIVQGYLKGLVDARNHPFTSL